jgi:hypothetical protein
MQLPIYNTTPNTIDHRIYWKHPVAKSSNPIPSGIQLWANLLTLYFHVFVFWDKHVLGTRTLVQRIIEFILWYKLEIPENF